MKDSEILGLDFNKATRELKKKLLFSLLKDKKCFRCGKLLDWKSLSVDHKADWRSSKSPIETFFDLGNIAFSHLGCNSAASNKPRGFRKTHCPRGHEYTKGNTQLIRNGAARRCKRCWAKYRKGYYKKTAR